MPEIALVVPCYNESARAPWADFAAFLTAPENAGAALLLVDDGSTDGTADCLRTLEAQFPDRVRVLILPGNVGKGEAVRRGMRSALEIFDAPLTGYWDADLATPLDELARFAGVFARNPEIAVVCGCRLQRLGADIRRRAARHYLGRCVAALISLSLGLAVYDSQCGAKLFRGGIAAELFAEPFATRWLFDVELLARFRSGYGAAAARTRIFELPLRRWRDVGGSSLSWKSAPRILIELLRIARLTRHLPPERSSQ